MEDIEKMAKDMLLAANVTQEQIEGLVKLGYFTAPASANHHLAFPGGLVNHSLNVTRALLKLTGTFGVEWSHKDSPIVVGMLHDLVKCKCYREKPTQIVGGVPTGPEGYDYVDPGYPGHGLASTLIAKELGIKLEPDEEAAIRWHMGLFDAEGTNRRDFSMAIDEFGMPVLLTHFADWISARVTEA